MRPSRVLAVILVVLMFPVGTALAQQTIYGCAKNNSGQLRIVAAGEACLPSEHPVQWSDGSAVAVNLPPQAPGPLRVVDQNGVVVGAFVSPSNAARQAGDVWVALPVTPNGFQVTNPTSLMTYYQSADCSGDAYLPLDGSLVRTGYVMQPATGPLAFSYPGKPEADPSMIKSFAYYSGAWMCFPFTPSPWAPQLFGKVASLDVSAFQGPFKMVQ